MEALEILNVTVIEPKLKHPTIFNKFDELDPGTGFIIHNDHDPKPLYYQLLGERGNIFTWEYLENGPEWWKVKIVKNQVGNNETVGEVAAKDWRKAEVFKKFGIDFCCGGKKSLKEACNEVGITEHQLEEELLKVENQTKFPSQDFNNWNIDFLTDYIVNTHHKYVADNVEVLHGLSQKVAQHHGSNYPELHEVAKAYAKLAEDLLQHMQKEEKILFPYIKEMVNFQKNGEKIAASPFGTVKNPISLMEQEHEAAGEDFSIIRSLSNNYKLPEDACNSYTYLYEKLKEFEADLNQHIHLENNILFPKALKLERELVA